MLERVSDDFRRTAAGFLHNWRWLRSDFADEFHQLLAADAFSPDSGNQLIWRTRTRYVLKIPTSSGRVVVFKFYGKLRIVPYLHHGGAAVREAENFHNLAALGIPMARLLAAGGSSGFAVPRTGFIVTEFVDGSRDGRAFSQGGELELDRELKAEFVSRSLTMLAKLHDAGFHHRGFTPANELWRRAPHPDEKGNRLELFWIDVASCRREKAAALKHGVPDDLSKFLKPFNPLPEELRTLLQTYRGALELKRHAEDELFDEVSRRLYSRVD